MFDNADSFRQWLKACAAPYTDQNQQKYYLLNGKDWADRLKTNIKYLFSRVYGWYDGSDSINQTIYNIPIKKLAETFGNKISQQLIFNLLSPKVMLSQYCSLPNRFIPGVDEQLTIKQLIRNFFGWHHKKSHCRQKLLSYTLITPVFLTIIHLLAILWGGTRNTVKFFTEFSPISCSYLSCCGYVNLKERTLTAQQKIKKCPITLLGVLLILGYYIFGICFLADRSVTSPLSSILSAHHAGRATSKLLAKALAVFSMLLSTMLYLTLVPILLKALAAHGPSVIATAINEGSSMVVKLTSSTFTNYSDHNLELIIKLFAAPLIIILIGLSLILSQCINKYNNQWHLFSVKEHILENQNDVIHSMSGVETSNPTIEISTTGQEDSSETSFSTPIIMLLIVLQLAPSLTPRDDSSTIKRKHPPVFFQKAPNPHTSLSNDGQNQNSAHSPKQNR